MLRRVGRAHPWSLVSALVAAALLSRLLLGHLAPGIPYYIVLLPALTLAGVFCGTRPAAVGSIVGIMLFGVMFQANDLRAWPPTPGLIGLLLLVPGAATVLWATATMRRALDHAADAEARLAEVFRQIPGAAAIIEAPDGRVLLSSHASRDVLGHPRSAASITDSEDSYQGLHPDGRRLAGEEYPIVRALRRGEVVRGESLRYRRPEGMAELEVHAGPVRDAAGRIVAAVGMAFDVTERVRAEQALRALSDRLATAVEAGELGLWETDLATRRTRWDARFAAMLGLPPADIELSREAALPFFETEDFHIASGDFERAVREGGDYASEFRARTMTGEERWLLVRGVVLHAAGRALGVVRDVTERRRREEELRAAVEARELLLREADHRIKNSLQLVVSLLTLQRGRLQDPQAADALTDAIARVHAVAHAHLALQESPDLRNVDVAAMVRELCGRLAALNPALALRCQAGGAIAVAADKAIPLGLMLSEVVTNALRHAYQPGAAGWIEVRVAVRGEILEVAISDGGRGLPVEGGRRGLGSRVVSSLAAQIGAAETTSSAPEDGTTVTFRLPLDPVAEQAAA